MCVLPSGEKQADNGRTDTPVHQTRGEHSKEMLVGRAQVHSDDRRKDSVFSREERV